MEKFSLQENEKIIGRVDMHYLQENINGSFYVTNQRVCFKGNVTDYLYMELSVSETAGYDTGRFMLAHYVRLHDIYDRYKGHKHLYKFTGLSVKKLCRYLEQAGINRIQ